MKYNMGFLVISDENLGAVNGVAAAKPCDSVRWSEVTPDRSPLCEQDGSGRLLGEEDGQEEEEEEEELLPNDEDDCQSGGRMSGASSPQTPYEDAREAEWGPLPPSDKAKDCSPSRNGPVKEEPPSDLAGLMGRANVFQRYRPLAAEEDSEGEAEARPARLDGWALGLHEMSRGHVNFSLLEQAIALQTEQRQVLHHAYREMDRFLMEQMSNERRHQRLMEMDNRLAYHGGKGRRRRVVFSCCCFLKCPSVTPQIDHCSYLGDWELTKKKKERKEAYAGRGGESESVNPLRYRKKHSGS